MKTASLLAGLCLALLVAACASVGPFTSVWQKPGAASLDLSESKVAVVYMGRDAPRRIDIEQQVARELGQRGIPAVAAEPLAPPETFSDVRAMTARFRDAGVGAVLIFRVLDHAPAATPPPYDRFPPPLGYLQLSQLWGYGWGRVFEPGYLKFSTLVTVETLLYSVPRDDLLWAGRSSAVLRSEIPQTVHELALSASSDMAARGLLARQGTP